MKANCSAPLQVLKVGGIVSEILLKFFSARLKYIQGKSYRIQGIKVVGLDSDTRIVEWTEHTLMGVRVPARIFISTSCVGCPSLITTLRI